ncbi:MAG: helix-turn-helix domain-containing protein [Anaerolineae bacterium]|nr:helix-turn-helix domain-containing protein [Anaerolineae bacterium]
MTVAAPTATDLKTVLKLALPVGSRLVTGYPNTPVNHVANLRIRPPIFAGLDQQDLILVSTEALSHAPHPLSLEAVIEKLSTTPASGLCVQGTLTPRTQQIAQHHNFPLIALSQRATLPQVERAVQRLLTDPAAQLDQRATELQHILQRAATSGRGLTTLLNEMARMLDRPIVVHNRHGQVIGRGLPNARRQDWDAHLVLARGAEFIRRFDLEDRAYYEDNWQVIESPAGITAPLIQDHMLLGYVSALTAGDRPDDLDLRALEYSAGILTREVVRQRQPTEVEIESPRPARDWIADWLNGPMADDALLALRASRETFESGMWYAVVLFHWVPATERFGGAFSAERMVRMLQSEIRQRRINAPVGQYADRAVVLFPLDEPQQTQRLKQIVGLLHGVLTGTVPDGEVTVGVGRPAMGLTALRDSFREADRALALPTRLWDAAPVAFFGDVSLYGLLLNVNDPELLAQFVAQWLAPLVEYDAEHNTELLYTLNAYFTNNGNMARTAHELNIHRNTLVYRLGRITEILQLDMDDSNVRLNLHLALKIHRLLHSEEPSGPGI